MEGERRYDMPKKTAPAFEMYIEKGFCKNQKELARAIREVAKKVAEAVFLADNGTVYNKAGDGCGAFRIEM
jgi:hypothetical protein